MTNWHNWFAFAFFMMIAQHYASPDTRGFAFVIAFVCFGTAAILKSLGDISFKKSSNSTF